jgi:hypothetical protein
MTTSAASKGLYAAVNQRLIEGYSRVALEATRAAERPADTTGEIRRILDSLRHNQDLLRVRAWSRLEGSGGITPGEDGLLDVLRRRIESAGLPSIIRQDIDPRSLSLMLVGLVGCWSGSHSDRAVEADDVYLGHVIRLLEQGLVRR